VKVQDPSGQTWRVTRRWVPWRPRWRDVDPTLDLSLGDDLVSAIVLGLIFFVLTPIVVPLLLLPIELVLVGLVVPIAALVRVLFGRRWVVEVRRGFTAIHEEQTGTWNDASVRIAELAAGVERGELPRQTLGAR
jgi:hypothetical protein